MSDFTGKITEVVDRTCDFCGGVYQNKYTGCDGYVYSVPTQFCSKRCSALSLRKQKGQNDPGKEELQKEITSFIQKQGRYCTGDEILSGIGRSSKTIYKHGISLADLNSNVGFSKKGSIFQSKVEDILKKQFPDLLVEKTFDGMVGKTGHPLRVDFYIPSLNAVIEADGKQHCDPNHPWHTFKNGTVAEYDDIKERFLNDRGIKIVRVRYKPRLRPQDVLSVISDI